MVQFEKENKDPGPVRVQNYFQNDGLSTNQFRAMLVQKYEKEGVLNQLKTQLRRKVLEDLIQEGDIPKKSKEKSLRDQALDVVVAAYLRDKSYECSLSVFIPESELNQTNLNLTSAEIQQMLGIRERPSNPQANALEFMVELLNKDSKRVETNQSVACQTAATENVDIVSERLRQVDEEFFGKFQQQSSSNMKTLEERMINYQQQVDRESQKEIERRMQLFEETRISAMRIEESNKYRQKVAEIKEEYEDKYGKKFHDLSKREEERFALLEKKEQQLKKESFEHRQNVMKEIAKIQKRENSLKNAELNHQRRQQELEEKIRAINYQNAQQQQRMRNELSVLKKQYQQDYDEKMMELKVQREQFDKEKISFDAHHVALEKSIKQQGDTKFLKESLDEKIQVIRDIKSQMEQVRNENHHLKVVCDELRQENNKFKYHAGSGVSVNLLTNFDDKHDKLLSEKQDLEQRIQIHVDNIQSLRTKNSLLENDTVKLRKYIEDTEAKHARELETLRRKLQDDISDEQSSTHEVMYKLKTNNDVQSQRIQQLEASNEELYNKLDDARIELKSVAMELKNAKTMYEDTKRALNNTLNSSEQSEMQHSIEQLESMVKKLNEQLERQKSESEKELQTQKEKLENEKDHSNKLQSLIDNFKQQSEHSEKEKGDYSSEVRKLKQEIDRLEKIASEREDLVKQKEIQRTEEKQLEQEKFNHLKEKYDQLQQDLKAQEDILHQKEQQLESERIKLAEEKKSFIESEKSLEDRIKTLTLQAMKQPTQSKESPRSSRRESPRSSRSQKKESPRSVHKESPKSIGKESPRKGKKGSPTGKKESPRSLKKQSPKSVPKESPQSEKTGSPHSHRSGSSSKNAASKEGTDLKSELDKYTQEYKKRKEQDMDNESDVVISEGFNVSSGDDVAGLDFDIPEDDFGDEFGFDDDGDEFGDF